MSLAQTITVFFAAVFSQNVRDGERPISIEIAVPDTDIIERITGRRVHPGSGRVYHVHFNPPKVDGIDDVTGEPLLQRDDDLEPTVRRRLEVYHEQTEVLIGYYSEWAARGSRDGEPPAPLYRKVSGTGTVDEIRRRVFAALA